MNVEDLVSGNPYDSDRVRDRLYGLRMICSVLLLGLTGITVGIVLVVRFALGAAPLLGNGGLIFGSIPVLTVVTGILCLSAPFLVHVVRSSITREAVARWISAHPNPNLEGDTEGLIGIYSQTKFIEFAFFEAAAMITAVLFHLTADWIMIGFTALMIVFMALHFPTTASFWLWFDRHNRLLDEQRIASTHPE